MPIVDFDSRGRVSSTVMLLQLSLSVLLFALGCVSALVTVPATGPTNGTAPAGTTAKPDPSPTPKIRSVDFKNFTFPEMGGPGSFTLKNGAAEEDFSSGSDMRSRKLIDVVYGDVTADGIEDAMVVINRNYGGGAIRYFVYVYTMSATKPKLLQPLDAGGLGDRGLRHISADAGEMVVELYDQDVDIYSNSSNRGELCCPRFFTRSRYTWADGRFLLTAKETLPNPKTDGSLQRVYRSAP